MGIPNMQGRNGTTAGCETARHRLRMGSPCFVLIVLIATLASVTGDRAWGCRYSVRDVAFVNVHGAPWQLHLVTPVGDSDGVDESTRRSQWQRVVAEHLRDANMQHVWFDAASPEGKNVQSLFDGSPPSQPRMAVADSDGMLTKVVVSSDGLAATIDALVDSPVRTQILDVTTEALCAIVVFENGDSDRVAQVNRIVQTATRQVHDQMWMLEKSTRRGPVVINVPVEEQAAEEWLIRSLGIETDRDRPAVAILFGQGRRLGPVLYDQEIDAATIVARASLCGHDCECDLDRVWLYGKQMIHRWSEDRQRAVEDNLDFDPYSALVLAEVNQIVRTQRKVASPDAVDLGPGLRIYDLAALDPDEESARVSSSLTMAERRQYDGSPTPSSLGNPEEPTGLEAHGTDRDAHFDTQELDPFGAPDSPAVPWRLLSILAGLAVILTAAMWYGAHR